MNKTKLEPVEIEATVTSIEGMTDKFSPNGLSPHVGLCLGGADLSGVRAVAVTAVPPMLSVKQIAQGLANAPDKLDMLADWNDRIYPTLRRPDGTLLGDSGNDEVQRDLRNWAALIRELVAANT